MQKLTNLMDYLKWRGDLTFRQAPFCEVDSLVFSVLIYQRFSLVLGSKPATLSHAMQLYRLLPEEKRFLGALIPRSFFELAELAASGKRFANVKLAHFVEKMDVKKQMQFSAGTFLLPEGTAFVAYRGTDDSLIGWKEDLNMCFTAPIPSQEKAAHYLEEVVAFHEGSIRLGGHSKGGNLALYAAVSASAEIKDRILDVYNNDGPGLAQSALPMDFDEAFEKRLHTFVPQSSIVGIMMPGGVAYKTVHSSENGIFQHDPLSWGVLGGKFLYAPTRSPFGQRADDAITRWLTTVSPLQQRELYEAVYEGLLANNFKSVTDLKNNKRKTLVAIANALQKIDKATYREFIKVIGGLLLPIPAPSAKK